MGRQSLDREGPFEVLAEQKRRVAIGIQHGAGAHRLASVAARVVLVLVVVVVVFAGRSGSCRCSLQSLEAVPVIGQLGEHDGLDLTSVREIGMPGPMN